MSDATKARRPLPVLSSEVLGRMIGADLADVIDHGTLAACMEEAVNSEIGVTAKELAVARALLFAVAGSALMDGDRNALKDAGTLYRMVCAANGLLIGRPGGPAAMDLHAMTYAEACVAAERERWMAVCAGKRHEGCHYTAACGTVCNKCGRVV